VNPSPPLRLRPARHACSTQFPTQRETIFNHNIRETYEIATQSSDYGTARSRLQGSPPRKVGYWTFEPGLPAASEINVEAVRELKRKSLPVWSMPHRQARRARRFVCCARRNLKWRTFNLLMICMTPACPQPRSLTP
jgi:hypothetical protein